MKGLGYMVFLSLIISGCVVQPVPVAPAAPPPGVTYISPSYASPGYGYVWQYHPQFGWGWHHPKFGWHRGWR
jgi:hypothetical protein